MTVCSPISRRVACALIVLIVAIGGRPLLGQREDYDAGREALDAGRTDEAITYLERARAARPEPGRSRTDAYYPYFYLGLAYLGSDQPARALEVFSVSVDRQELATAPQLRGTRDAELVRLRVLEGPESSNSSSPGDTTAIAGLDQLMNRTGERIAAGEIARAVDGLETMRALALDGPNIAELQRLLGDAAQRKARQATELHLRGQHQDAIDSLEDALAGVADHPMAHLYLGFAYYTQYLTGSSAPEVQERALSALRTALRLDPRIAPAPGAVSPRLLEVLDQLRAGSR